MFVSTAPLFTPSFRPLRLPFPLSRPLLSLPHTSVLNAFSLRARVHFHVTLLPLPSPVAFSRCLLPLQLAVSNSHATTTALHVATALFTRNDLAQRLVQSTGVHLPDVKKSLLKAVDKLPQQAPPPSAAPLHQAFLKNARQVRTEDPSGSDKFLTVDHLLMAAMADKAVVKAVTHTGLTAAELKRAVDKMRNRRSNVAEERAQHRAAADSEDAEALYDALATYGTDLTQRARDGKLDPVIGRDAELSSVITTLSYVQSGVHSAGG